MGKLMHEFMAALVMMWIWSLGFVVGLDVAGVDTSVVGLALAVGGAVVIGGASLWRWHRGRMVVRQLLESMPAWLANGEDDGSAYRPLTEIREAWADRPMTADRRDVEYLLAKCEQDRRYVRAALDCAKEAQAERDELRARLASVDSATQG